MPVKKNVWSKLTGKGLVAMSFQSKQPEVKYDHQQITPNLLKSLMATGSVQLVASHQRQEHAMTLHRRGGGTRVSLAPFFLARSKLEVVFAVAAHPIQIRHAVIPRDINPTYQRSRSCSGARFDNTSIYITLGTPTIWRSQHNILIARGHVSMCLYFVVQTHAWIFVEEEVVIEPDGLPERTNEHFVVSAQKKSAHRSQQERWPCQRNVRLDCAISSPDRGPRAPRGPSASSPAQCIRC